MSKLLKVELTFDDHVKFVEGEEATKWGLHNEKVAQFASIHNYNPFDYDPIKWKTMSHIDYLLREPDKQISESILDQNIARQTDDINPQFHSTESKAEEKPRKPGRPSKK